MADIGQAIKLNESVRRYYFPNNEIIELKDVIELVVRNSGTHRLKTNDKKLHIIPTGWIHIEIETEDWTV